MDEGLKHALCALSYFRGRLGTRNRYKRSRRRVQPTVPVYREYVEEARWHIRLARAAGWRGSVVPAMARGEHENP